MSDRTILGRVAIGLWLHANHVANLFLICKCGFARGSARLRALRASEGTISATLWPARLEKTLACPSAANLPPVDISSQNWLNWRPRAAVRRVGSFRLAFAFAPGALNLAAILAEAIFDEAHPDVVYHGLCVVGALVHAPHKLVAHERLLRPVQAYQLGSVDFYLRANVVISDLEAEDGDDDCETEYAEATAAVDDLAHKAAIE